MVKTGFNVLLFFILVFSTGSTINTYKLCNNFFKKGLKNIVLKTHIKLVNQRKSPLL